ncbi:hypothetical protein EPUL_006133 [Erysiphe pulchra]|uniref:Uncharacterized protein n=1 Tax=Erysiphe pulchra TaxID=225359 RepID=A0A2S4PI62_9PEZI|nr:hypothetical protein EPUL_006133 [Erysiphe pulchra]
MPTSDVAKRREGNVRAASAGCRLLCASDWIQPRSNSDSQDEQREGDRTGVRS